ncbi:MAG: DNA-directed RNA polymerase subunit alpha [Myxococcota bacterium]
MTHNWRELIRPQRIEVEETLSDTHGRFECAPLERGFGITLGNALRRILLSSLQGAAITSIRIEGVLHEFTTIPGVLEDVTDVVLNLKEVRLRGNQLGTREIEIRKQGPGEVTAADFESPDQAVEILNPDHHIATLSEDAELALTALVEFGKGFVLAERHKGEDDPVGTIPIDSAFSPIRKVNYSVTNARVGRDTDYDKLTMELWTDGSISPADALAFAAKILKDQLSIFINFEEDALEAGPTAHRAATPINEVLFRPVDELELSVRSANCLQNAEVKYIGELVQRTEAEMLRTKNFGRKSLNELKGILANLGLEFGMTLDGFPSRRDLDQMREGS